MGGCQCVGCCTFPNGRLAIVGMLFAIISYGLAGVATYGCHYIELKNYGESGNRGFGLWNVEDIDGQEDDFECKEWTSSMEDEILDATWKGARAMGSIATASGFVTMVTMFCSACMSIPKLLTRIAGSLALLSSICIILTTIAFSADFCKNDNCSFGSNAGIAIGACIAFFITGIVLCAIKDAPDREQEPYYPPAGAGAQSQNVATPVASSASPPPGTVTVTETVLPDGSTKVTKTTVNADGSMTVEETVKGALPEMATTY